MAVQLCLMLILRSVRKYRIQFYDLELVNRQVTLQSPYLVICEVRCLQP
jgi:hypothetical protein